MSGPPPPPPPHGEVPKSSGLPPGKYDIFVIPEHSAGSGFLYLPSLQPNINSFVAGFASALVLVALFQSMTPAFKAWWESFQGLGNMGITLLIIGVGFGAWALGRTQHDGQGGSQSKRHYKPSASGSTNGGGPSPGAGAGGFENSHSRNNSNGYAPPPHSTPPPPPPPPRNDPPPNHGSGKPQSSWDRAPPPQQQQQPPPPPRQPTTPPPPREEAPPKPTPPPPKPKPQPQQPKSPRPDAKGSWEKARDEMRKKEEERKAKAAEQKRREDISKRLAELRAKEAKERLQREKDKDKRDREIRDAVEKKEQELKAAREAKERKEAEERAQSAAKTAATNTTRLASSYAYSGVGEKMSMWPNGKPPAPPAPPQHNPTTTPKSPPSPSKKPPAPTARTYVSAEEDTYSFRPYDKPKRQPQRKMSAGSLASDASWAASHTTAHTSPPPSVRGPYTTKDPDKIVIQAVYMFMNQYSKTPASQLISGVGSVTDGLILRITTEGLFIDDDVRGIPQREWDVKAWTLKLVEVWCPPHCLNSASASASASTPANKSANLLYKMATSRARHADRDPSKPVTGEEADVFLTDMMRACKECCRLGLCDSKFSKTNIPSATGQTGEWKTKGLHLMRATIRDQDGKRYLFVIDETEYWKVGASLQRLRRGTQVRQLGISSMTASEARTTMEGLGWTA